MRTTRKRTGPASERTPRPAIFSRRATPLLLAVLLTAAAASTRAKDPPAASTSPTRTEAMPVPGGGMGAMIARN